MKLPTLTPVKSSNIEAVHHAGDVLHVRFNGGAVYAYEGVSADKFKEFMGSGSLGRYLAANIRGKFKHRQIHAESHS